MQFITDYPKAVKNIRTELENYIKENNLKSLVLGISGGIDSALVAVLSYPVCIKLGINLIGRSITIETNKDDEIKRSVAVGKNFTTDFRHIDLTKTYRNILSEIIEDYEKLNPNDYDAKIRFGNLKARMRMIYLYELASRNKGLVLSTDNYTELLLGFWTLHGDVGDYGLIQNLWKTEVYAMAKYLAENEANETQKEALIACIEAIPTDGLGITHSDLDQIKANSYEEVDRILYEYIYLNNQSYEGHPVIERYKKSHFKRNNPFNLTREIYFR